jgi:hypothetical protein
MGDRGNIVIEQSDNSRIYLYSHWGGSGLATDLQNALAKRWRWDDEAYLARIIFDVMTDNQHGEETGFGISTTPPDNEYPILVVNCSYQTVRLDGDPYSPPVRLPSWTFEEFIALDDPEGTVNKK